MSFTLDSIFHTKAMIKILKDQGDLRYAEKICQEILAKNPSDPEAEELLKSIRAGLNQNKHPFASHQQKVSDVETISSAENSNVEDEETTV